jgi:hypothetical protein
MANQVDFKILPSDQFNVYSPQTRSDKIITYFTLLSKLRGDILAVGGEDDPNDIVSAFYTSVGGTQTLHLVKADGSEVTASVSEPTTGTVTSVDLTAGTGISVSGGPITTSGSITVTNTAPDQVVVLIGAGTTVVTGTYPSFTITSNDEFEGTVTSVGTSAPLTGGTITTTGTIGITQSGVATDGYLSSTDWNTFNSKEPALTKGNLTEATSSVLTITGGTGAVIGSGTTIQVSQAGASASGFLSSTDWNTFNNKQGTITLTTTGSTGAATFIGNTLNIPNYADQFVGTVTSVAALTLGTTGTDLSSSVVDSTTTPVITLNVPTASATNRGALSSADWTTFNSKEPALTKGNLTEATSAVLTITGGTGAVIGTGTTIQVAQAGASSSGFLSSTDWNTFNGKQSALTFSAPLVNTSGTITITQSGAATDGYLSSTDWNAFNSKEPALTKGNLTEATSSVLTITDGTNAVIGSGTSIQVTQSSSTTNGYLSSTDWSTFNGKASNSFTTIAVASQDNIVAESATDTLTIAAGTGVAITTDALTDTLTISATGSGGTVTSIGTNAPITGGTITGTGTIGITQSGAAADGYLTSTDWNTFNGKQDALTFSAPLVNTSGTISISQSGAATDGYLSSTDWNTFNGKQDAITLTTTGTSGAATLIGATLNIPDYTEQYTGTVTDVAALTLGTTGTDLSSTVANGTTTPVITLNVPTASATNRGALSSADWTTFNGKASNSFTTIAVSGQTSIVADTATDTLTLAAGTGISLTTNDTTDTLTITNTAATNIACFAAYTTQNLSLTTTEVEYTIDFDVESITNASFFTHSTTVDPEEITVLVAGKYEISMGYVASNGNSTIATVQGYVGINGFGAPSFSFLQLNTSTVGQYVSTGFNTYIYDLDANDVITAIFFPAYSAASTGTITINPSGYDGSTYITIKKIG